MLYLNIITFYGRWLAPSIQRPRVSVTTRLATLYNENYLVSIVDRNMWIFLNNFTLYFLQCSSLWCSYNLSLCRKPKLSYNVILRRLIGFPKCRTLLVNTRQDNIHILIRNFNLNVESSYNRVIISLFSRPVISRCWNLITKLRENTEVMRM